MNMIKFHLLSTSKHYQLLPCQLCPRFRYFNLNLTKFSMKCSQQMKLYTCTNVLGIVTRVIIKTWFDQVLSTFHCKPHDDMATYHIQY